MAKIEEIGGFPSDFVDPAVKQSREYALRWAQATDYPTNVTWFGSLGNRKGFDLLRAYARGDQPIDKYKPILGIKDRKTARDPNNKSYKVLNWEILDVCSKYVNLLVGKMVKRDNTIGVAAIDKRAMDAKRAKRIELQEAIINRPLYESISKATGIQFQSPMGEDVLPPPETLGEVDVHQEMFYKEDYCIATQDMLKQINEEDNFNQQLVEVARDICEVGYGATKTYRVGRKILSRRCVIERMGMGASTKDNFEDAKFIFEDWDITIGQLKELAGDQFTEEVYRKIAEKVNNKDYSNVNVREYYDKFFCYPWDNTKITVRDLIWFSPDRESYLVHKTPMGSVSVEEKAYDWWEELRQNERETVKSFNEKMKGEGVELVQYHLNNQYQCMWIKGTKYVFNHGKT